MSDPILQVFAYNNLSPKSLEISELFHDLARALVARLPDNPERAASLRKLLEARNDALRASFYKRTLEGEK